MSFFIETRDNHLIIYREAISGNPFIGRWYYILASFVIEDNLITNGFFQ